MSACSKPPPYVNNGSQFLDQPAGRRSEGTPEKPQFVDGPRVRTGRRAEKVKRKATKCTACPAPRPVAVPKQVAAGSCFAPL